MRIVIYIISLCMIWASGAFMYANAFDFNLGLVGDFFSYFIFVIGVALNLVAFKENKKRISKERKK